MRRRGWLWQIQGVSIVVGVTYVIKVNVGMASSMLDRTALPWITLRILALTHWILLF